MTGRLKHAFVCLVLVLVAYGVYAALAVPYLEPSAKLATGAPPPPADQITDHDRDFAHLFEQGSWELQRPKVLETNRGTLIFDDYKQLPDKQSMQLNRCTLVFYAGASDKAKARPIVLRAPQGATIFFDNVLNIPRGEFGRLIGGELSGEITIYSPPTGDSDNELRITTRDVRIEERRIWTPHDVAFRFGPNTGAGGDLSITMHPPSTSSRSKSPTGQIESFELVRVDRIDLQVPANKMELGGSVSSPPTANARSTPVEITCRGSLRFDFDEAVLSLNDHVDVIRHNIEGPSDQLNCQQLLIHFVKPKQQEGSGAPTSLQFRPRKIVALGLPVTLRASSMGAFVRGEQLEYDLITRRIWIQDREGVLLRDQRFEVTSTELEYELAESGRLGRLWAAGPGRATGRVGRDARSFEATWQQEVRLQPFRGSKVLSLVGGARVAVGGTGNVAARELHVFLNEQPRRDNPQRFSITPDRMKAVGEVRFDSPKLTGSLNEANLWFVAGDSAAAFEMASSDVPPARPAAGVERLPPQDAPPRKLAVTADLVNAQLALGKKLQIIELGAKGKVHCEELQAVAANPAKRLVVDCDVFQLVGGDTANPIATLTGQPASVTAEGATLVGESIALQQGRNTAEIRGPGAMSLPPRKNQPQPLHVKWKQQMQFDGQFALFSGDVLASGAQTMGRGEQLRFQAHGEALRVRLTKLVDFKSPNEASAVELADLAFRGPCRLDAQTLDPSGQRQTLDTLQTNNLSLNQLSGQLHGDGPGWLTSVHHGQEIFREGQLPRAAKGLNFLRVDFQRELVGSLNLRQMEFLGGVRTVYGPVANWDETIDANNSAQLRARDVVVTAERLAIADMGQTRDRFDAIELEATGNAFVRGQTFTASGQRVSYVKSKDQLVLEGDGRNYAVLTYRRTPSGPPAPLKARKILFWPETKQFELNDFHSLELENLSQFRRPQR